MWALLTGMEGLLKKGLKYLSHLEPYKESISLKLPIGFYKKDDFQKFSFSFLDSLFLKIKTHDARKTMLCWAFKMLIAPFTINLGTFKSMKILHMI